MTNFQISWYNVCKKKLIEEINHDLDTRFHIEFWWIIEDICLLRTVYLCTNTLSSRFTMSFFRSLITPWKGFSSFSNLVSRLEKQKSFPSMVFSRATNSLLNSPKKLTRSREFLPSPLIFVLSSKIHDWNIIWILSWPSSGTEFRVVCLSKMPASGWGSIWIRPQSFPCLCPMRSGMSPERCRRGPELALMMRFFLYYWTLLTTFLWLLPHCFQELELCSLLLIWEHSSFVPNCSLDVTHIFSSLMQQISSYFSELSFSTAKVIFSDWKMIVFTEGKSNCCSTVFWIMQVTILGNIVSTTEW